MCSLAGSGESRAMVWTAKLVTVFNDGLMPKVRTEDAAFATRLMIIPHRSLFCDDPDDHAEPYTYLVDGSKEQALTRYSGVLKTRTCKLTACPQLSLWSLPIDDCRPV